MTQPPPTRPLPWLEPGQAFPPVESAWGDSDPAPGLLAAGGVLDVPTLVSAYSAGIFPWYSTGQPVLWWSTNPRMILRPADFRLHRSLRKTLQAFCTQEDCEIRVDHAFKQVITACATKEREGQAGTWIVPEMVEAYTRLHAAGHAHSVETWVRGELVGGLYCVALGQAVFGEAIPAVGTPLYTDVRIYGEHGIPGVIYGAGPRTVRESNAKRADENLVLEDLRRATKVVARTLLDVLQAA